MNKFQLNQLRKYWCNVLVEIWSTHYTLSSIAAPNNPGLIIIFKHVFQTCGLDDSDLNTFRKAGLRHSDLFEWVGELLKYAKIPIFRDFHSKLSIIPDFWAQNWWHIRIPCNSMPYGHVKNWNFSLTWTVWLWGQTWNHFISSIFEIHFKPHLMKRENFQSLSMGHRAAQNLGVSSLLGLKVRYAWKFRMKTTKNRDFGVLQKLSSPFRQMKIVSNRHFWEISSLNYRTRIVGTHA